jgi:hypothetical protein
MMNNPEIESQLQAAKELATQAGIGGVVYLDVDQAKGTLRMKFKVTPAEEQDQLILGLTYVLVQMSQAIGLQVNTREVKNEGVNNV